VAFRVIFFPVAIMTMTMAMGKKKKEEELVILLTTAISYPTAAT